MDRRRRGCERDRGRKVENRVKRNKEVGKRLTGSPVTGSTEATKSRKSKQNRRRDGAREFIKRENTGTIQQKSCQKCNEKGI